MERGGAGFTLARLGCRDQSRPRVVASPLHRYVLWRQTPKYHLAWRRQDPVTNFLWARPTELPGRERSEPQALAEKAPLSRRRLGPAGADEVAAVDGGV